MMKLVLSIMIVCAALSTPALGVEKEELVGRYRDKFVVVMRKGLAIGVCEGHPAERGLVGENIPSATVIVVGTSRRARPRFYSPIRLRQGNYGTGPER